MTVFQINAAFSNKVLFRYSKRDFERVSNTKLSKMISRRHGYVWIIIIGPGKTWSQQRRKIEKNHFYYHGRVQTTVGEGICYIGTRHCDGALDPVTPTDLNLNSDDEAALKSLNLEKLF